MYSIYLGDIITYFGFLKVQRLNVKSEVELNFEKTDGLCIKKHKGGIPNKSINTQLEIIQLKPHRYYYTRRDCNEDHKNP